MSPNAIGKRLKRLGVPSRRAQHPNLQDADIKRIIETILPSLPETVGYRSLTSILRRKGYSVKRDAVMKLLREVDPEGSKLRRRKRIIRRTYHSFGPNHIWHVDGYDKLKPYGFAIHGCIDGFSRKLMWLNVGPSNNDPAIVARNFVERIQNVQGCPLILQADPGTENTVMGALQCVFRHSCSDDFSGVNSFRVSRSVFNQRIEAWWSIFRRRKSQWWINFFKDLEVMGIIHRGNINETYCPSYCFMPVLRLELIQLLEEWNSHYISHSRLAECPNGRPDILYALEGLNCLQPVTLEDIALAQHVVKESSESGSSQFDEQARQIFSNKGLFVANHWTEALHNYVTLLSEI